MSEQLPRYTQVPLPHYSYVPGHTPHPVSDPAGHMWGQTHQAARPLEPMHWQASEEYRYGIDLFNHGFYWEAHEAWESLWHAAGRQGTVASFLKGLIKLAAAGVKAREGNPRGVNRHAKRAIELFAANTEREYCGLIVDELRAFAKKLVETSAQFTSPQPEFRFDHSIKLQLDNE